MTNPLIRRLNRTSQWSWGLWLVFVTLFAAAVVFRAWGERPIDAILGVILIAQAVLIGINFGTYKKLTKPRLKED